ncbi:MAG: hypothetical protein GY801_11590 [bacterium]|nr:hypothetical protein [bacterium]
MKTDQQQKTIPASDTSGDIYTEEFFIRNYVAQIQKVREYYLEHGWTKPNTRNLRCLYNRSPQFREMCDDDPEVRHVLQCLFHDEQPAWDTHYKAFLQYAESRLRREPTERESTAFPVVCLSVSLRFLLEFWNDAYCAHQHLAMLKDWLSSLYQKSDNDTQKRIKTDVLPILFDVQEISVFFRDWEETPNLQDAYRQAIQAPREQLPVHDETGGLERSYRQALKECVRGYVAPHTNINIKRTEEKNSCSTDDENLTE